MAGLLVQLRPFVGQLWAALYSDRADGRLYLGQIATALKWLKALFSSASSLTSVRYFRPPRTKSILCSDASPWGGGALLYVVEADFLVTADALRDVTPWGWMATIWDDTDVQRAQATIGEAAGQARWEAYAAVCAFRRWKGPLLQARGGASVMGDALGVLLGMGALRSKDPHINKLFGELALVLAPVGSAIECLHVCAEDNALADELSRMTAGSHAPACLNRVPRTAWHSTEQWWIV